jgi:cell division protein ZapA (FtsZ GTPase activity inhibitor)
MTTVTVTIGGQSLRLRTDDESRTLALAATVDGAIREMQSNSRDQSTLALSLITALTFADREQDAHLFCRQQAAELASELLSLASSLEDTINATK